MALDSTTCGIVHHARRTRAHCPTMVSSFKLSSGTVCLLGLSCRAGHIRKGKYKICGSYQVQICTSRNGIVHHARRLSLTRYITASGHTACVMHNAVPTSADLHLVGTTNLKNILVYLSSAWAHLMFQYQYPGSFPMYIGLGLVRFKFYTYTIIKNIRYQML